MSKKKKVKSLHELRIAAIRRASMRWTFKYEALNAAKVYIEVGTYKNEKPKIGVFFLCAECERQGIEAFHKRTEVQVDHINPVIDTEVGFKDWNDYVPAVLCLKKDLQILCKPHHKQKTAKENSKRLDKKRK